MGIRSTATNLAVQTMAPGVAGKAIMAVLHKAIDGLPGFAGAREVAQKELRSKGDVDAAVSTVITKHLGLAGAQGFATGLGGLPATAVMLPANVTALALVHIRMVAAIAHLRGYDLARPGVRLAVLEATLGPEDVEKLLDDRKLPGRPRDVAGMDDVPEKLFDGVAGHAGRVLLGRVTGKQLVLTVARRIPLLGGGVGAVVDGLSTRAVGSYANEEFTPRLSVERADT